MMVLDGKLLDRWIEVKDAGAFSELVSRRADLVHGASKRIVRSDADAQDVAQECFLKLACAAPAPRTSVLGWLHAVATRSAVDFLRARPRRRSRERVFAEADSRKRSAAPSLENLKDEVDACIARLPAEIRDVIVGHFLERRTQEEIAAALGVSRQTVSCRVQKRDQDLPRPGRDARPVRALGAARRRAARVPPPSPRGQALALRLQRVRRGGAHGLGGGLQAPPGALSARDLFC